MNFVTYASENLLRLPRKALPTEAEWEVAAGAGSEQHDHTD